MVARLGIGASSASAVIFSVLLVSNFVVYASSQDRQRLYLRSDAEDSLADGALALAAAGATNVLLGAERLLGSGPFDCPSAVQSAARGIGGLSDVQRSGGLTVTVSAAMADVESRDDNLSMVAPFNGSAQGGVNIALAIGVSGSIPWTGVSLAKSESHLVHLSARLGQLSSDCVAAFDMIAEAVSRTPGLNCTAAALAPALNQASEGPASVAASDGFRLSLQYSVESGKTCSVALEVALEQTDAAGPGGTFSVLVQEAGSVSFEQGASQPRA
jgi:hypothetical protein